MRNLIIFILCILSISSISANFEKDMKYYYNNPPNFWWWTHEDDALACYFKLSDFGIKGCDYKIKIIGFIGNIADGLVNIYITSKERWNVSYWVPVCSPKNNWEGAEYGPKSWHINNSYPNYDDCNVYDDNWHYSKDIDKFWCIYYIKSSQSPYPHSDDWDNAKNNSLTFWQGSWSYGTYGRYCNWCMHCVIVYWGADIENTSLGVVKALFR